MAPHVNRDYTYYVHAVAPADEQSITENERYTLYRHGALSHVPKDAVAYHKSDTAMAHPRLVANPAWTAQQAGLKPTYHVPLDLQRALVEQVGGFNNAEQQRWNSELAPLSQNALEVRERLGERMKPAAHVSVMSERTKMLEQRPNTQPEGVNRYTEMPTAATRRPQEQSQPQPQPQRNPPQQPIRNGLPPNPYLHRAPASLPWTLARAQAEYEERKASERWRAQIDGLPQLQLNGDSLKSDGSSRFDSMSP